LSVTPSSSFSLKLSHLANHVLVTASLRGLRTHIR
jgi:hypothetical protein